MAEVVVLAGDPDALFHLGRFVEFLVHRAGKSALDILQGDAVLRALGTGKRGLDGGEIELEHVGEHRVRRGLGVVHALRLGIGRNQRDHLGRAAGVAQITHGVVVDRREAAGGAVFRRHVAERGAVGDGQMREAGAEEFDELADHAALAQHFGDGEHQVGGGEAFLHAAGELEADHLGQHHRQRLIEHGGFALDAADAPAQHRQSVDHGGVRVGADHGVGIGDLHRDFFAVDLDLALARPDHAREIFEIDLVADAGAGRHHAEIVERALRPLEEFVAFLVLPVFLVDVLLERLVIAEEGDRHRMIDHQIDRHLRIDLLGVAAEHLHGVAHGREIDHARHAGEVLQQHTPGAERDLALGRFGLQPLGDRLDIVLGDRAPVFVAQQVLQQHLHRERQARNALEAVPFGGGQAVISVSLAAGFKGLAATKTVERSHVGCSIPGAGDRGPLRKHLKRRRSF